MTEGKKRARTPGRVVPVAEKEKPGRPRKEPPADVLQAISNACSTGASKTGVAMALGVNTDVLNRWIAERPDIASAFNQGRERERQALHDVLATAAKGGNIVAAMFLLKARHGYREGEPVEQRSPLNVTFNIPAAMPLDRFTVIENGQPAVQQLPGQPPRDPRRD